VVGEIVRRIAQVPLVLFFVTIVIFSLLHLAPGDPVYLMIDDTTTEEEIEALRHKLGLDRPLNCLPMNRSCSYSLIAFPLVLP
jgi:peptide/nickel transport system permease protein